MKRLSTGVLAALIAVSTGLTAVASPSGSLQAQGNSGKAVVAQTSTATPNFGTPPSGKIPILFNDHHVYSKPDTLKQGRVLAALVKGGTILIPLRSMFEQMGASVSYDAASKTVSVSKPGSDVKVTVGKPEVIINGESRPLDVAPIIYQGTVLVPVRVISEGMGAYVQWVPDKQLVVVRYVTATPPPTPAPTEAPTVAPTPTPTPTPTPRPPYHDFFVAGDYVIAPQVYNEFSPGNHGTTSYAVRGAIEFDAFKIPWMVAGNFVQYEYPHNCGGITDPQCLVTTIGSTGQTFVPGFRARDSDLDARIGIRVLQPRVYVAISYDWHGNNYGYPRLLALGFGGEKLPDLDHSFSVFGSAFFYPNLKGAFTDPGTGVGYTLSYNFFKYQFGVTLTEPRFPVFLDLGYMGDSGSPTSAAPTTFTHAGPFVGLGFKIPVKP